jgi:hypothetical protein
MEQEAHDGYLHHLTGHYLDTLIGGMNEFALGVLRVTARWGLASDDL